MLGVSHACRKAGGNNNNVVPTTRRIRFSLARVVPGGTYTLRVALAAAHMSRIQVHVNGGGNAIARHGIHGVQWDLEIPIRGYLLNRGQNVISITQPRAFSIFFGVMYDYVRLEGPSGS
jgi:rhamnogalacturonan endolyase